MARNRKKRPVLLAGMALAALLAPTQPASASEELRKGIDKIVKQLLDGKSEDSIAAGVFSGPANYPTSAGPGIQQLLAEELQKLSVTVK